jgi:hypothetical protein
MKRVIDKAFKRLIAERWCDMNRRCREYESYKHVEVKCTREEFVTWMTEQKNIICEMYSPSIDRIDNQGHYEFTNMQVIEHKANVVKQLTSDNKKRRGVSWHKQSQKWHAYVNKDGKRINLGLFQDIEDAYHTYFVKYVELYGEKPW